MHIYIICPKLVRWNFFKSLGYLYEVVRTKFPPIIGIFAIFHRNFANIAAPSSNENVNCAVHLKKGRKPDQNRPINCDAIHVRTMHLSNEQRVRGPERDKHTHN